MQPVMQITLINYDRNAALYGKLTQSKLFTESLRPVSYVTMKQTSQICCGFTHTLQKNAGILPGLGHESFPHKCFNSSSYHLESIVQRHEITQ
jgi:hypothetical protein